MAHATFLLPWLFCLLVRVNDRQQQRSKQFQMIDYGRDTRGFKGDLSISMAIKKLLASITALGIQLLQWYNPDLPIAG